MQQGEGAASDHRVRSDAPTGRAEGARLPGSGAGDHDPLRSDSTVPAGATAAPVRRPRRTARRPWPGVVLATFLVWLPMVGWLSLFQPGMMSPDSMSSWAQAKDGGWTDAHPPAFTALLWVSDRLTGSPVLATLGQSLLLAAGIVAVAAALVRLGVRARWAAIPVILLAISPMVGGFAVSLWKDVPYTAVVLLAGARTIDVVRYRLDGRTPVRCLMALTGWLTAVVLLRQNGLLLAVALLLGLLTVTPGSRRWVLGAIAALVVVLFTAKTVVYPALGIRPSPPNASIANVLHDVAAQVSADPEALDPADRRLIETLAPVDSWISAYRRSGCWSQNWQFDPAFRWDRIEPVRADLIGLWRRLAVDSPMVEARNRACVSAIAWSPFPVGPTYTLERSVAPNDLGVEWDSISDPATESAVEVLQVLDRQPYQSVFWRAPGWMLLASAAAAAAALRARRPALLATLLPLLALAVSVVPVNPSQDARYMVPGLIFAVLLLPIATRRGASAPGPDDTGSRDPAPVRSARRSGPATGARSRPGGGSAGPGSTGSGR